MYIFCGVDGGNDCGCWTVEVRTGKSHLSEETKKERNKQTNKQINVGVETLNSRVWTEYFRLIPAQFATRYFLQLIARDKRGDRIRSRSIKSPPQRLPKLADRFSRIFSHLEAP